MTCRIRIAATVLILVVSTLGLFGTAHPVSAEQPSRVVTALRRDGVFVHNRRDDDIDREKLAAVVEEADRLGYKLAIVIPNDPLPELRSFVLRVQQGGEFDAVLGFGFDDQIEAETGDALSGELLSALRAVRNADGTPEELSALFLAELTTEPEPTIPDAVWRVIRWVGILLAGLVVAGILEQIYRSVSKRGQNEQPTA